MTCSTDDNLFEITDLPSIPSHVRQLTSWSFGGQAPDGFLGLPVLSLPTPLQTIEKLLSQRGAQNDVILTTVDNDFVVFHDREQHVIISVHPILHQMDLHSLVLRNVIAVSDVNLGLNSRGVEPINKVSAQWCSIWRKLKVEIIRTHTSCVCIVRAIGVKVTVQHLVERPERTNCIISIKMRNQLPVVLFKNLEFGLVDHA
mmetsp:Transcript_77227/g.153183  ORF Transcript_77227/g.153183 Transcript_77227/m.153183 type:complete len:201 (-) Transcript_77227:775-1377(-)